MAGGQLILFLAKSDDMIDAVFKSEPRSLGNTMHGLEYLEKTRWGRFRRYGLTEPVGTGQGGTLQREERHGHRDREDDRQEDG